MLGFRRSCRMRSLFLGLSVALGLLVGAETARAVDPTIDAPFKWLGGVQGIGTIGLDGVRPIYTVPAQKNFMLTDLIPGNPNDVPEQFHMYVGNGNGLASFGERLSGIIISPYSSLVIPLNTGIGFGAGTTLCMGAVAVGTPTGAFRGLNINARGYLYGPK